MRTRDAEILGPELLEELRQHREEASERFQAHIERLMEGRGVESLEELHRRFVESGYAYMPVPGLHRGKPVSLGLFKRIAARKTECIHMEFVRGLEEVLGLTEREVAELIYLYMWGGPRPVELREA